MLRKMTALLSLIMALGLTMGAAAQDMDAIQEELPGIESAYARMFMPDLEAMFESVGTPGAEIEFDENGVVMVMTSAFTFDSEDNAASALESMKESFIEDGGEESGLEPADVEDLGDKATMYSGNVEQEGTPVATVMLLVQDGNYAYMILIGGGELEEGKQQAKDLAQFMIDAEVSTEEITLNPDGTSTGGVFDLMPTAEDTELVSGLVPFSDMDLMEDAGMPGL